MSLTYEIPRAVCGVFAYLEAVLSEEDLEFFATTEIGKGDEVLTQWDSPARRVVDRITDEFRLMHWGSPIRKALADYRLYHKTDMACALTCAFALHRQGRDVNEALRADYTLQWGGVLRWATAEEIRSGRESDFLWPQFSPFVQKGDRFVHYSLPTQIGTMLLRGDRLVWCVQRLLMSGVERCLEWEARNDKFKALGGIRGFLAGEFDWPPTD